jgi:D-serine deaminase-like pyridoxal phosphate-dependent protein
MDSQTLTRLHETPIDWRFKGLPSLPAGTTLGTLRDHKLNLLAGDLLLPALVLRESAVEHNLRLMAEYCAQHGLAIAPHAKTSMAPQLLAMHLDAGAWGFTVATTSQARVLRAFGVERLLLASQIVEPSALRWFAGELDRDEGFELLSLIDSTAQVESLTEELARIAPQRPLRVLVELGFTGGRTGCRSVEEAVAVAQAVHASPGLELAGVEGFEGIITLSSDGYADDLATVDRFLLDLRRFATKVHDFGGFDGLEEVVVTAGGSSYFDRVAEHLRRWDLDVPVRTIIRSGCYSTHDHEMYEQSSPLAERSAGPRLEPAFEAWGAVWSRPEPELAIVGMGKRDIPYDYRLPVPLAVRSRRTGERRSVQGLFEVTASNDQHAYLGVPANDPIDVGDLVAVGISHPCTAFDKWRLVPIVDDDYTVTGGLLTFF